MTRQLDSAVITGEAVPDHLLTASPLYLPVYRDNDGYTWIEVTPGRYACLDTPLLRALEGRWHLVTIEAVTEVARELTPLRAADCKEVYVIVGQGGDGSRSLVDRAGLSVEAVFTDPGEAERYESMGDMETHVLTLDAP